MKCRLSAFLKVGLQSYHWPCVLTVECIELLVRLDKHYMKVRACFWGLFLDSECV